MSPDQDFPIQPIIDHLVRSTVEVLPSAGAGVLLMGSDNLPHYVAGSDPTTRAIEELQRDLGEGPGFQACTSGEQVLRPNLLSDRHFARFAAQAGRLGFSSAYAFPLGVNGHVIGALDVYRTDNSALAEEQLNSVQMLADAAAAYLFNARVLNRTQEVAAQSQSASLHDPLTGLPNLTLLSDRLDQALRRSPRAASYIGVLLLEIDGFAAVNDLYGPEVSDQTLVGIAQRLTAILRPGDTLSRLADDEFVVLCEDLTRPAQIHGIAGRILRALATPFTMDQGILPLSGSVGVTVTRRPGDHLEPARIHRAGQEMLRLADTARLQARTAGGGRYAIVTSAGLVETSHRHLLDRDLPAALSEGDLRLAYQMIADAGSGICVGVEALLRWDHPSAGAVDAATIVSTAERIGLMPAVGRWVLRQACADLGRWRATGALPRLFTVAVNVSPTELVNPSYPRDVGRELNRHGIPAAALCLELTESVLIEDSPTTVSVLGDLKRLGVTIALDDFGTGYSTMTYLRRLPADIVKVDRSFLSGFDDPADSADQAIVGALITLSHALGLTVVAEGVETRHQLERLRALGCDLIQGHLISLPVAAEQVPDAISRPREWSADSISLLAAERLVEVVRGSR